MIIRSYSHWLIKNFADKFLLHTNCSDFFLVRIFYVRENLNPLRIRTRVLESLETLVETESRIFEDSERVECDLNQTISCFNKSSQFQANSNL